MAVVGEASNGTEAVAQIRALAPDLVVMDVNMPGATGIDGVREARRSGIDIPIIMLTISDEDDDLFEAIKAGANGYLLKNLKPEQLFEGIRGAAHGEAPISPAIATRLLDAFRHGGPPSSFRAPEPGEGEMALTRRESEILRYVADRALQQGDRRPPDDHRGDGQEPRPPRAREAPPHEPGPGRGLRGPPPNGHGGRLRVVTSHDRG